MAELTALGFGLLAGIIPLMFLLFSKPETPAQARRRLYREATAWDKEIHLRTWDAAQRANPKARRPKYKASKARINRRVREMMQD